MGTGSWASSEAVRKSMRGNRSRDTTPELRLRRLLWSQGLRYRVCARPARDIRRKVDIVFGPTKVAVEVRGCFWHGCPDHYRAPTTNSGFWSGKVAVNRARDAATEQALREAGWEVVVVWEHEDFAQAAARVAELVRGRRADLAARKQPRRNASLVPMTASTTVEQPTGHDDVKEAVHAAARRARAASKTLALLTTAQKDQALHAAADALLAGADAVLAANGEDIGRARAAGTSEALLDRLRLTEARVDGIASGLRQVAGLADPVGEVVRGKTLPNGMELRQQRVPLGVVGMVYEARPNVTVDAFGLAFKSGNAALLRGSSSAARSNAALVAVLRGALEGLGLPADAVQLLPSEDRSSVTHLIQARGLVDVVIPRGGAGLIEAVVRDATVPTIETGVGNCHVYVHAAADLDKAEAVVVNSKARRPSVCNTAETLLVDAAIAGTALPRLLGALAAVDVTAHGDLPGMVPATEDDWSREYLSLDIAVKVVSGIDEAVAHIDRYGTGHTEAIVTGDLAAAREFTARVDAAAVMVNASTAFTDGEQFGFGAEIGISTQKLHARGPMGLPELTSTKWIVWGDGHTRPK